MRSGLGRAFTTTPCLGACSFGRLCVSGGGERRGETVGCVDVQAVNPRLQSYTHMLARVVAMTNNSLHGGAALSAGGAGTRHAHRARLPHQPSAIIIIQHNDCPSTFD